MDNLTKNKDKFTDYYNEDEMPIILAEEKILNIKPYIKKYRQVSLSGLNKTLALEKDWYVLKIKAAQTDNEDALFLLGYAPEFTKKIIELTKKSTDIEKSTI